MEQVFDALYTSAGMLWKALWALIFGYLISAGIQILVTKQQMANVLGGAGTSAGRARWPVRIHLVFLFIRSAGSIPIDFGQGRRALERARLPDRLDQSRDRTRHCPLGAARLEIHDRQLFAGPADDRLRLRPDQAVVSLRPGGAGEAACGARTATRGDGHAARDGGRAGARSSFPVEVGSRSPTPSSWSGRWCGRRSCSASPSRVSSPCLCRSRSGTPFSSSTEGGSASPSFLIVLENALVAPIVAFFTFIGSMGNGSAGGDASFGGVGYGISWRRSRRPKFTRQVLRSDDALSVSTFRRPCG